MAYALPAPRRLPLLLGLVLLLPPLIPAPGWAQTFVFHFSGDQEVPPVPSTASGGCHGDLDEVAGTLELTCVHDVAGATLMHVHRGAAGVNGPVAFDLGDPASPVLATWTGMTSADVAELLAGGLYINIHTAGRPAGEIRGQVLERTVDLVAFAMDGGQVVPPVVTPATGSCSADLDDPATQLLVGCTHSGLPSPLDAAHLHEGPFGVNGPIAFTFASAASPISENVPMTPLLVAEFAARFLYVEIHAGGDAEDSATAIRGQIGPPPATPTAGGVRITKRSFPPGASGFAFGTDVPGGPAAFSLDDGQSQLFSSVPAGTYVVSEDDPGTSPGGFDTATVECDDADSIVNPFARSAAIALGGGELVTCTFTNVASLGVGQLFVFHLAGVQEVPSVPSTATGGCAALFDAGAVELTMVCTHDVVNATIMHVHRAPSGANGPIAFDLGAPTSPVVATWSGMTPADVADLFAGNLYVNLHAGGRPDGEIRGQILPRTVDRVEAPLQASQEVPPADSAASGSCSADLSDDGSSLAVACAHTVVGATMAHLHSAPRGSEGPVAFTFTPADSPFAASVPTSLRLLADFAGGLLYVNVHSAGFPEGEVRGQLAALGGATLLEIPSLGRWGLIALAAALSLAAWRRLAGS